MSEALVTVGVVMCIIGVLWVTGRYTGQRSAQSHATLTLLTAAIGAGTCFYLMARVLGIAH